MPDKLVNIAHKNYRTSTTNRLRESINKQNHKQLLRQELIRGLSAQRKYISSKFFYDKYGSELFNWITQLPEYYVTRTEKSILSKYSNELFGQLSHVNIIELGSGDCSKISMVLNAIPTERHSHLRYYPIDVSPSAVNQAKGVLHQHYPNLKTHGIIDDITKLESLPNDHPRIICFFGSTIGNFQPTEAEALLQNLYQIMHPGDQLILGIDLIKDIDTLELAYNDSQRITEAFNKNVLRVCNSILRTQISTGDFEHRAFFNPDKSRIEMHLIASHDVIVNSPHLQHCIEIFRGENIHTENSHKYSLNMIEDLAAKCQLSINRIFYDDKKWFALVQLIK